MILPELSSYGNQDWNHCVAFRVPLVPGALSLSLPPCLQPPNMGDLLSPTPRFLRNEDTWNLYRNGASGPENFLWWSTEENTGSFHNRPFEKLSGAFITSVGCVAQLSVWVQIPPLLITSWRTSGKPLNPTRP